MSIHGTFAQVIHPPGIPFLQRLLTPFLGKFTQWHLLNEAPVVQTAWYLHPSILIPTPISCSLFSLSITPVPFQHHIKSAYIFCLVFIICFTPLECKHVKGRRFVWSMLHLKCAGWRLEPRGVSKNVCWMLLTVASRSKGLKSEKDSCKVSLGNANSGLLRKWL